MAPPNGSVYDIISSLSFCFQQRTVTSCSNKERRTRGRKERRKEGKKEGRKEGKMALTPAPRLPHLSGLAFLATRAGDFLSTHRCPVHQNTAHVRTFHSSVVLERKDHYKVLGITPKASPAQVKSAYYRLTKQFHPDVNPSQEAKTRFEEISEAYEILGNQISRRNYDGHTHKRRSGGGLASATRARATKQDPQAHVKREPGQYKERPKAPMYGKTQFFNFDEFYKQHYGEVLRTQRADKKLRESKAAEMKKAWDSQVGGSNHKWLFVWVVLVIVVTVKGMEVGLNFYDRKQDERRKADRK